MRASRVLGVVFALAVPAATSAGCAPTEQLPPSGGTYTVTFPSTAAAVATDKVTIYVFDASPDGGFLEDFCPSLVQQEKTKQTLPTPLLQAPPVSPCDLLAGKNAITIPYGPRAVLAVATTRDNADFLVGCAIEQVSENSDTVPVVLTIASDLLSVPATKCTQLSDLCAGKCM